MSLLSIKNLSVRFKTASGMFSAVENVSLDVEKGEVVAIVGESGCGKSVSMLALMGLLPWTAQITSDSMRFDGIDLDTLPKAQRRDLNGGSMSMIFQEPMSSLNPCFTVGAQIDEMIRTHSRSTPRERKEHTLDLLAQVGIPDPKKRYSDYPHQMSGGMSQRVMIAMAIACSPKLLIADEPTTALDVTIQAQILDLLLELQSNHDMGLILITHDMGVVAETAHRVAVQYAGQQVEMQPVVDLFERPRHPYTSALLSALPERATSEARLPTIPGVVPGQYDRPQGCLFNPRCAFADDLCRSTGPTVIEGDPTLTLCHHPMVYSSAAGSEQ
ncbi:MAG: ABC transporter ATP-binding protein [Gammaproteobacteria bacterium]|nr:ABC transporter ATP-binding protein [Gammaproteobacteria bacterium]